MKEVLKLNWKSSPAGLPLAKRISEAIIFEIRQGRLVAGSKLPSSRVLAHSLGVHRGTAVGAYEELIAQGYVETRPGSGTFVVESMPAATAAPCRRPNARSERMKLELTPGPSLLSSEIPPGAIPILGGLPDLRALPTQAYARALRAAVKNHPECFDYQSPSGQPRFVAA